MPLKFVEECQPFEEHPVDFRIARFGIVVTQTFLHPLADPGKKPWTRENAIIRRHRPGLPDFGPGHEPGVAENLRFHDGESSECAFRDKFRFALPVRW